MNPRMIYDPPKNLTREEVWRRAYIRACKPSGLFLAFIPGAKDSPSVKAALKAADDLPSYWREATPEEIARENWQWLDVECYPPLFPAQHLSNPTREALTK